MCPLGPLVQARCALRSAPSLKRDVRRYSDGTEAEEPKDTMDGVGGEQYDVFDLAGLANNATVVNQTFTRIVT
jgi:hypothetical protein